MELVRVTRSRNGQKIVLNHSVWEDPAAWGILLVDLARHLSTAYSADSDTMTAEDAMNRIMTGFEAERRFNTDE